MPSIKKIVFFLLCVFCVQSANAQWKKINSGTLAWLHSVHFINQKKGWIVGSKGTFLETNDGGTTWTSSKKVTQDTIQDIYFADENRGWILAEKDVFGSFGSSPSYILETFDGGENWKRVNLEDAGKERLVKIFFSKDGFGRAVGESGTLFSMQADKRTWKRTPVPVRFLLLNGSFFNQINGLVVGGGGTALFTEDGGNNWDNASFTSRISSKLYSIFFINPKVGWTVGAEGKIFTTVNGGKFWREQNSKVTNDLLDVFFLNTAEGWAIGDSGTVLHTTTAGNIWTPLQTPAKHKLEKVFFIGKSGWAVGFGGTVMKFESTMPEKPESKPTPLLQKRSYSAFQ